MNTERGEELFTVVADERQQQFELTEDAMPPLRKGDLPIRICATNNYVALLVNPAQKTPNESTSEHVQQWMANGMVNVDLHLYRRQRDGNGLSSIVCKFHSLNDIAGDITTRLRAYSALGNQNSLAMAQAVASMDMKLFEEEEDGSARFAVTLAYWTTFYGTLAVKSSDNTLSECVFSAFDYVEGHLNIALELTNVVLRADCRGAYLLESAYGRRNAPYKTDVSQRYAPFRKQISSGQERVSASCAGQLSAPPLSGVNPVYRRNSDELRQKWEAKRQLRMNVLHHSLTDRMVPRKQWVVQNYGRMYVESFSMEHNPISGGHSIIMSHSGVHMLSMDISRTILYLWAIMDPGFNFDEVTPGEYAAFDVHLLTVFTLPRSAEVVRFSPDDSYLVVLTRNQANRITLRWRVPVAEFADAHALRSRPPPPSSSRSRGGGGGDDDDTNKQQRRQIRGEEEEEGPPIFSIPPELTERATDYLWTDVEFWEPDTLLSRRQQQQR